MSKGYLNYHRLSEDLDFTYLLPSFSSKSEKISHIKSFVKKEFIPKLIEICDFYGMDFKNDIENQDSKKYCPVKFSDFLIKFYVYMDENDLIPVKIEINFVDNCYFEPYFIDIIHLNPMSEYLVYPLKSSQVLSYDIKDIILEKLRAILTREVFSERDFFDLFLIENEFGGVFDISLEDLDKKIQDSGYRLKDLNYNLFKEIDEMALIQYNRDDYKRFVEDLVNFLLQNNLVKP